MTETHSVTLDELIARGLISAGAAARVGLDINDGSDGAGPPTSPDAAQGLIQQVADLKNRMPWEGGSGGGYSGVFMPRSYGQKINPANTNQYGMVNKSGKRVNTDPDYDHLVDSIKSYNGDLQKTIDGYRDSYANNPRPERLDEIRTLESWKQQGFKLSKGGQ